MTNLLMKIDGLTEGTIIKRPSKIIKSPYVADILTSETVEILGHTASLGCCGLADTGASVLMTKIKTTNKKETEKPHCEYRVYLSVFIDKEKSRNYYRYTSKISRRFGGKSTDIQLLIKIAKH